jgi:hypothetical protein
LCEHKGVVSSFKRERERESNSPNHSSRVKRERERERRKPHHLSLSFVDLGSIARQRQGEKKLQLQQPPPLHTAQTHTKIWLDTSKRAPLAVLRVVVVVVVEVREEILRLWVIPEVEQ